MNYSARWSFVAFVAVPVVVWLIAALTAWRQSTDTRASKKISAMLAAFIAGADGRLSLSRAQAFVWTLVIFGAYAAAFVVHVPYESGSADEAARADTALIEGQSALARADSTRRALRVAADQSSTTRASLQTAVDDSTRVLDALVNQRTSDAVTEAARVARVAAMRATLVDLNAKAVAARQASELATTKLAAAAATQTTVRTSLEETKRSVAALRWIAIPAALLALAGLSIGTGVFSSLISSATDSSGDACVTSLDTIPHNELSTIRFPELGVPREPGWPCGIIYGRDLGKSGYVRFGRNYADVLYWGSAGSVIVVQVPPAMVKGQGVAPVIDDTKVPRQLAVDTANGKRVYGLTAVNGVLQLGESQKSYDWLDLFRDDRNPAALALTKFQMFGWTVIAVVMYVFTCWRIFGRPDAPYLQSLPDVDASLVILMGVSQAAYLAGKAVSGVTTPPALPPSVALVAIAGPSTLPVLAVSQPPAPVPGASTVASSPLAPSTERVAPPGPLPSE
ncbi:MAG: hypothetical protein ABIT20_23030 [Gemmatimonadaceae bacterium]